MSRSDWNSVWIGYHGTIRPTTGEFGCDMTAIEAAWQVKRARLTYSSNATYPVWWRDNVPVVIFALSQDAEPRATVGKIAVCSFLMGRFAGSDRLTMPLDRGPFDPKLPVLTFRKPNGQLEAIVFNHSTHTINTRKRRCPLAKFLRVGSART